MALNAYVIRWVKLTGQTKQMNGQFYRVIAMKTDVGKIVANCVDI